jgi:hypothetical protein
VNLVMNLCYSADSQLETLTAAIRMIQGREHFVRLDLTSGLWIACVDLHYLMTL